MSHVPAETKMASVTRTDEAPMPRNFSNSTLPPLSSDQLFKCTRCQVNNLITLYFLYSGKSSHIFCLFFKPWPRPYCSMKNPVCENRCQEGLLLKHGYWIHVCMNGKEVSFRSINYCLLSHWLIPLVFMIHSLSSIYPEM